MAVPLIPGASESLALGSALLLPWHGDLPGLACLALDLLCAVTSPPPPVRGHPGLSFLTPAFVCSLRGNSIGVAGAQAMANALKVNRSLRHLK